MKKIQILLILLSIFTCKGFAQSVFELSPSQSMSITGKGPGQDAAINPFSNNDCIALIENIGKNEFSIRIQAKGELPKEIALQPKENKRIILLKGEELYLDSNAKGKAKVEFLEKSE